MKIVIAGAGEMGSHLARMLSGNGHDITIIDSDQKLLSEVGSLADVITVEGDSTTFAVLRRFMECLLREFTAMNARPPAIRPAALLLIYASVFFDMVISSFLKVYIDIFCNFRKNIPEAMPEIDSSDTWNARKYVLQLRKITFLS